MSSKLWKVLLGFAIPLLIVGIIMLVVGKVKENGGKEKVFTVVDAGGSGTRLSVYIFKVGDKTNLLTQHTIKCEGKGLGNWDRKDFPELERKLVECYENSNEYLPVHSEKTPIWFGATAGMRLMKYRDPKKAQEIWDLVHRSLNTTNFNVLWANVFSGKYEARYSWIAVNILRGTTKHSNLLGMTEMGSSSTQLAFAVDEKANATENIDKVKFNGEDVNLYEYSYLCYGKVEALRRTRAELIKKANFTTNIIDDPCSNAGYNWTLTPDYLWSIPCVKGDYAKQMFHYSIPGPQNDSNVYRLRGTGNPQECLKLFQGFIPNTCQKNKPCGLDDVSQPTVRGKYLALSSFYYSTNYIGLPFNGNQSEYWEKASAMCETPYDDLSPTYPDDPEKFKSKYCFDSIFTYFLLDDGFKFDNETWDVEYTHKIQNKGVKWTLGAAYDNREHAYLYKVIKKEYRTLFIVGVVIAVIALIMIIVSVVCIKRKNEYEKV